MGLLQRSDMMSILQKSECTPTKEYVDKIQNKAHANDQADIKPQIRDKVRCNSLPSSPRLPTERLEASVKRANHKLQSPITEFTGSLKYNETRQPSDIKGTRIVPKGTHSHSTNYSRSRYFFRGKLCCQIMHRLISN